MKSTFIFCLVYSIFSLANAQFAPLNKSSKTAVLAKASKPFAITRTSVPPKITRTNEAKSVDENGRYCTTALVSEEKGDFEKLVLGIQNDKIYPGAIYYDNALVEGTYNAPSDLIRRPYEIVTDMFSASTSGRRPVEPVQADRGSVYGGISNLMRRAQNVRNASNVFVDVKSLNSNEQLEFELGAGYEGSGVNLQASFSYFKQSQKNVFIAKLKQVYFSVTVNSNYPGRLLVTGAPSPNLMYLSKVNYGRVGYLIIESDQNSEAIRAALNFRYSGSGNSVNVDARVAYEKTLATMRVQGYFLGGDANNSVQITSPNQLGEFNSYVRNGLRLDPNVAPTPISFEMKFLNDDATAGIRATTTYTERQCEPGKGIKIKLHNVAIEDIHGGDCSYAWGTAQVEVWETDAQRRLVRTVNPAPDLAGNMFWNQPDGRNPLRAVVNFATVRGQGSVESGLLNAIGTERTYFLDPKVVADGRVLIKISLNVNTNHKDNDFAALGYHGMNRVETRDYWLKDVVKTSEEVARGSSGTYKYGTLQVGKFCSNTDRQHCFYGLFSITNTN
ncbi:thiol-activated cytolysin family protein [Arundinibacter roseus]|nr:thiol-activated cytolysin family protein [Arundinibacter roseus]